MGYKSWSSIKRAVEAWTGVSTHNKTLYHSLNRLIALSIVVKEDDEYDFTDPVYREAARRITL
jgi:hypothetical protein